MLRDGVLCVTVSPPLKVDIKEVAAVVTSRLMGWLEEVHISVGTVVAGGVTGAPPPAGGVLFP